MKLRRAGRLPFTVVFGVIVLVTAFGGFASGSATPLGTDSSRTVTVQVRPVNAQGKLVTGYRVVKASSGASCSQESFFVSEAWRCFAGSAILDPCWAESGGALRVVCQGAPWEKTVWRLNLSEPLAKVRPLKAPPAWGMELATGNRCSFAEGATDVIHGLRLNYACVRNDVWLAGWTIRTHSPWRIQTAVFPSGRLTLGAIQPVSTVWRALPAVFK